MKDLDRVSIHYHDSRNPGRVALVVDDRIRLDLSAGETVALAERLLTAVASMGYTLTARKMK